MRTAKRTAALVALWAAVTRQRRHDSPEVREQAAAVPRLVLATLSGRYPGMSRRRLGLMAVAVAYVVAPVDLFPEAALLLVGLADDAVVLAWLAGALLQETDDFLAWESARGTVREDRERVVPGSVVG